MGSGSATGGTAGSISMTVGSGTVELVAAVMCMLVEALSTLEGPCSLQLGRALRHRVVR